MENIPGKLKKSDVWLPTHIQEKPGLLFIEQKKKVKNKTEHNKSFLKWSSRKSLHIYG